MRNGHDPDPTSIPGSLLPPARWKLGIMRENAAEFLVNPEAPYLLCNGCGRGIRSSVAIIGREPATGELSEEKYWIRLCADCLREVAEACKTTESPS